MLDNTNKLCLTALIIYILISMMIISNDTAAQQQNNTYKDPLMIPLDGQREGLEVWEENQIIGYYHYNNGAYKFSTTN